MDYQFHKDFVGFSEPGSDTTNMKDASGRYRVGIFLECNAKPEIFEPLYTLRERPHKGLPSAYLIYMLSSNEYEAALKLTGSWHHWLKLLNHERFMDANPEDAWHGLNKWREEKEIQEKAVAHNQLKQSAEQGNVQAQKLLYEGKVAGAKRGRPSKADIKKAAEEAAESAQKIKEDLKRIRLVTVDGKKKQAAGSS